MSRKENNNKKTGGKFKVFFVGSVLGGIIGSATALLFAPKEGKKLRKDLTKKCQHLTHQTQDFTESAKDKCMGMLDSMKSLAKKGKKTLKKD